MRVLVTGHQGYIGPAMITRLRAEGHEVVGLDSSLFAGSALEAMPTVPSLTRDLRDTSADDLRGFDAVVHLAGLSNDRLGSMAPSLTYEINADATFRLALAARDAGVKRFLFSSSCSVYGEPSAEWVDEQSAPRPVTPYGSSKLIAEHALETIASPSFCVASLRSATAFGYSPNLRADLVVNDLVAGAYLRGEVRLNGDGSTWQPLVHVQDIAQAFALALKAPAELINRQRFNVGAEHQNYRMIEIAETVARLVPGARLTLADVTSPNKRGYRVRFDKLHTLLPGFRCQYDLETGVRELRANFGRVGLVATAALVRLAYLRDRMEAHAVALDLRPREPAAAAAGPVA